MIPKKMDDKPSQTFFIQQFHEIGWLDPTVKKTDGGHWDLATNRDREYLDMLIDHDRAALSVAARLAGRLACFALGVATG